MNNHTEAKTGIIGGHLPLEHLFGFCRSFTKISKSIGLAQRWTTSNRKRNTLCTKLGDIAVDATIKTTYQLIPTINSFPEAKTISK